MSVTADTQAVLRDYLATHRDPEASGLVTTYHPWEGTDNSPRWDRALQRITVAKPGQYTRLDANAAGGVWTGPAGWLVSYVLWPRHRTSLRRWRWVPAVAAGV